MALVFLIPQVYRPLNVDFASRFELLSAQSEGYIFTFSSHRYRGLNIGSYRLYAEPVTSSPIMRWLKAIYLQGILPAWINRLHGRVDAIIAYDPYQSGLAGLILKRLLKTKLIIEINGDYHMQEPASHPAKRRLMRSTLQLSLRMADAIKVLNPSQEEYVSRVSPSTPIYRFPDFVATRYFKSLTCRMGDYLLSVGHPFDLKGMDVLIHAFNMIAHRHPRFSLRIMGYCPPAQLEEYKTLAQGNPRVEFVPPGWIEDVGEQMRGCYALVNAARSEAMGKVHLEAMACRKPIVATRTNGGLTCVRDGTTGYLFAINDVSDLAARLDTLLSDRVLAKRMGEAGYEYLQTLYSENRYVHSLLTMVRQLVSPHGAEEYPATESSTPRLPPLS